MISQHPWSHDEHGRLDREIFQALGFSAFIIHFELNVSPFIEHCKSRNLVVHQALMKVCHHLSKEHLPQRTLGLNARDYPAGSAAGYVRVKEKGLDPIESIVLHEVAGALQEVRLRESSPGWLKWIMKAAPPRFTVFLGKRVIPGLAVRRYPALQVSRNYLPGFRGKICGTSFTTVRSHTLGIPHGSKVVASFGAPHCFANIQFYEPFLEAFRSFVETPECIPAPVLDRRYIALT